MTSFEYKVHLIKESGVIFAKLDMPDLENTLNGFGDRGWELVTSFVVNQNLAGKKAIALVFKRALVTPN